MDEEVLAIVGLLAGGGCCAFGALIALVGGFLVYRRSTASPAPAEPAAPAAPVVPEPAAPAPQPEVAEEITLAERRGAGPGASGRPASAAPRAAPPPPPRASGATIIAFDDDEDL